MDRHFALTWRPADLGSTALVQRLAEGFATPTSRWIRVLDIPGLLVFQTCAQPPRAQAYLLPGGRGVILGKVFQREADARSVPLDPVFDAAEADRVLASAGRRLIHHYWGRYTAFLCDREQHKTYILRDPTAGRPSYEAALGGTRVFFSDVEDLFGTGLFPAAVNWDDVARFLLCRMRFGDTCLDGVTEILPGECVELRGDVRRTSFYWDPREICRSGRITDFDAAADALRGTAQFCINGWASSFRTILHNLSGGFDSAVVLACLGRTPDAPRITCLNHYQAAAEGDERRFARMMAEHASCPLIENEMAGSTIDLAETLLSAPRTARPLRHPFGLAEAPLRDHLARTLGAESFWTGQAGDELFFRRSTRLVAAEFAQDSGPGLPLLRVVHTTARGSGENFWTVLAAALRHGVFGRPVSTHSTPFELPRFIADRAARHAQPVEHPWLEGIAGVPAAKMIQIQGLVSAFQLHDLHAPLTQAEWLHPLMAQPLIELCLRIPSYLLLQGGSPRALARHAFAADLPPELLARTTKGTMPTYYTDLIARNAPFLRAFLLDGQLASKGLLERKALEHFFAATVPIRRRELGPVVFCIGAEAWARSWAAAAPRYAVL